MKKFFTFAAFLSASMAFSQVVSGNIGIGTTNPTAKLDINNGTTPGAIKIVDGTQGDGKVLTSDANGVGTWSSTPVTSLYFLSANAYPGPGSSDFSGTINPITGASVGTSTTRYLVNLNSGIFNFGPATTITSGSTGLSYRIPVDGLYRITLYVDVGYTGARISTSSYRNGSQFRYNTDNVIAGASTTMINIWQLQQGDIVLPISVGGSAPTNGQLMETTFTVERVN